MKFVIEAHGTFEADNIDDAFLRVGRYFTKLGEDGIEDESLFEPPTSINISKLS